ncbi:hypothetical protein HK096_009899, partial [Nowakowskiella sp. JEL0078]
MQTELCHQKKELNEKDSEIKKLYAEIRNKNAQLAEAAKQLHHNVSLMKSLDKPGFSISTSEFNNSLQKIEYDTKNCNQSTPETLFDVRINEQSDIISQESQTSDCNNIIDLPTIQ